jgi:hypothetical protein
VVFSTETNQVMVGDHQSNVPHFAPLQPGTDSEQGLGGTKYKFFFFFYNHFFFRFFLGGGGGGEHGHCRSPQIRLCLQPTNPGERERTQFSNVLFHGDKIIN